MNRVLYTLVGLSGGNYLAPAEYFGFRNCDSFGEVFCHE